MASVWGELKRRNVVRVALAYAIVSWLILQLTDVLVPLLSLPGWVGRFVLLLLLIGLVLALFLSWAYELTPEGVKKEKDIDRSESITNVTGRKLDFVIIGLLAVTSIYFAYDKFVPDPDWDVLVDEITTTSVQKSIAVLPFDDLSQAGDQEYFSDGMTEEIITKLSHIGELRVISRTTVNQFKDSPLDVPNIGRKLNVNFVLEGSVRKAADRIRVTAQLIDTDDDSHMWADNFDAKLDDVFTVQEDIAHAIVTALGIHLTDVDRDALTSTPTDIVPAYESYLRGQALIEHWNELEMINAGRVFFQRALELDPSYVNAMAGLASVEAQMYRNHDSDPARLVRADKLLDVAQAIDPNLVRSFISRGEVMAMRNDYPRASAQFRKAVELETDNYYAWDLLCWSLGYETPPRADEAEQACREGLKIAPNYGEFYYHLSRALTAQARYDEASAAITQLESILPGSTLIHSGRVWLELAQGNYSAALEHLDKSESGQVTAHTIAIRASAQSAMNNTAEALRLMDQAMAMGFKDLAWINGKKDFDSLRQSPEFDELLEKYGLD